MINGYYVPADCKWFTNQLAITDGNVDSEAIDFAVSLCKQHRVAVDVGAHIGLWSIPLSRYFESIFAYEPNNEVLKVLEKNIKYHNRENISVFEYALGNRNGKSGLRKRGNSGMAQVIVGGKIPITKLDSIPLPSCDLIKIDVEGMNVDVIKGGEETIRQHRPVVVCEENIRAKDYGYDVLDARSLLESFGMKFVKKISDNIIMRFDDA